MLGLPGETLENSIETFSLNREMRVSHVRVNMNVPLPGSELAKMVDADGEKVGRDLLSIDRMPDFSEGKHFVNHVTSERDFKNLMLLFPFFYRFKSFIPAIRFFSRKRYLPVFRVFSIVSIFMEKRFFRIGLISGIKYFLRTGSPYKRSKNSASLI
jgi:radical SAM superfamily enzyme YgiQ (UPF0313 family)